MCDPVSLIVGSLTGMAASKLLAPKVSGGSASAASNPDPAAERAAAEAEAAQRANAQLTATNKRRREQQSLMAKGAPVAPQFSLGDSSTDPGQSPLSPGASMTTRNSVGRAASLMSRGAPAGGSAPFTPSGGGGSYRRDYSMQQL